MIVCFMHLTLMLKYDLYNIEQSAGPKEGIQRTQL